MHLFVCIINFFLILEWRKICVSVDLLIVIVRSVFKFLKYKNGSLILLTLLNKIKYGLKIRDNCVLIQWMIFRTPSISVTFYWKIVLETELCLRPQVKSSVCLVQLNRLFAWERRQDPVSELVLNEEANDELCTKGQ